MRNRFRNMVDYAKSYYFSFAERPLNEIDALIFSWLSYLRLDKTFIRFTHNQGAPLNYILDSKRINKESLKTYDPEMTSKLLIELGKNPRFSNITISNIVEKWNERDTEQFYAMTINYKDLFSFISYRGTDATMVGWKEDVMMGVSFPVRGQIAASSYLEKYFTSFNKVSSLVMATSLLLLLCFGITLLIILLLSLGIRAFEELLIYCLVFVLYL